MSTVPSLELNPGTLQALRALFASHQVVLTQLEAEEKSARTKKLNAIADKLAEKWRKGMAESGILRRAVDAAGLDGSSL